MSGIINYFHGESGDVAGRWWQLLDVKLAFSIELAGDPHRVLAKDYGSDVGIDPLIQRGDRVVYLRIDDTCGIWVRESDRHGRKVKAAVSRVLENREWMRKWDEHSHSPDEAIQVAEDFFKETKEPLHIVIGEPLNEYPATRVSLFLSHSSRNTLLARQLYEDLRTDSKANIWFDLAQPRDTSRDREEAISKWLRESVESCKGFILLLTRSALESKWVSEEIGSALEQQHQHPDFQIVTLKTDDSLVPEYVKSAGKVIDCDRIWWSRGVNEELYAAIYGREGRRAWLSGQHGHNASEGMVLTYKDFATDSGTVVNFSWKTSPSAPSSDWKKDLSWSLEYTRQGKEIRRVEGGGKDQPADLELKPGDRIGFVTLRRRRGWDFFRGLPIWMRSDDLNLTFDAVLDRYYNTLSPKRKAEPAQKTAAAGIAKRAQPDPDELEMRVLKAGLGFVTIYGNYGSAGGTVCGQL